MKRYIFLIVSPFILFACNKDIDSFLLNGSPTEYQFTNADLNGFSVDESLVDNFTLISDYEGIKESIEVLYVGDQNTISTDTVILFFHGNGGNMNGFWQSVGKLANIGGQHRYGIMMFDYRGFGNSTGSSENVNSMVADAEACAQWLKDKGLTSDRFIVYGSSLGAMSSSHHAAYSEALPPSKLILEAAQTSVDVFVQDAVGGLSLNSTTVTDFGFDTPTALDNFDGHFLWIHGSEDGVANYANFLAMYESYSNDLKQKYIVDGAGHGVVGSIEFDVFENLIIDFLKK